MESIIRKTKINKYQIIMMFGIFFMFMGLSILVYNHYSKINDIKVEEEKIEEFFNIAEEEPITNIVDNTTQESAEERTIKNDDYIAILEIPKIDLKKGLVDKDSYQNNVDRNIYTLKETIYPNDEVNSHIILASHSGNSSVSYFRYINRLNLNDIVYIYYKNTKYIYSIIDKYEIEKNGKLQLKHSNNSNITLISCVGLRNQVVIIGNLVKTSNY